MSKESDPCLVTFAVSLARATAPAPFDEVHFAELNSGSAPHGARDSRMASLTESANIIVFPDDAPVEFDLGLQGRRLFAEGERDVECRMIRGSVDGADEPPADLPGTEMVLDGALER